ncbi:tetratricopeptide repeat protein [Coleofasciculus sp.]|uniref:tetratricopeptide repeat protein n=1 Tax=Coleofasciculus sp. TaxID=3100458 RepID=UPI0039FB3D6A
MIKLPMMQRRYHFVLLGLTLSILPTVAIAAQNRVAEGRVMLKREGWSSFRTVTAGTPLHHKDQLQAIQGETAKIVCQGKSTHRVPSAQIYPVSYFCGTPRSLISTRTERILKPTNSVGGDDPTIPYMITPHRGKILDGKPTIRWNPVAGVSQYTVRVTGSGVYWETQVSGTEVVYPGEPVLQPGKDYLVVVEANGTSSQLDKGGDYRFKLVYPEVAQRVQEKIEAIAQSDMPEAAQALTMADVYFEEDLDSEAIAILESLVKSGSQTVQVYQLLGDLYAHKGLNLLAQERYEQAIELAIASEDIEGQAKAQVGLAEVMIMLGKPEQAIRLFNQAQAGYEALGHSQRVEELHIRTQELAVFNFGTR